MAKKKRLTKTKARQILHDDSAQGHPLTAKQQRFFGAVAGGQRPRGRRSKLRRARSA